jgi:hypothetical protein
VGEQEDSRQEDEEERRRTMKMREFYKGVLDFLGDNIGVTMFLLFGGIISVFFVGAVIASAVDARDRCRKATRVEMGMSKIPGKLSLRQFQCDVCGLSLPEEKKDGR